MKKKTAGLLATLGLLLSACGASSADPGGGGFGEAIAVHGNWTIDVVNPDGSLDQHVEFQNAFTGPEALSELLTPTRRLAGWRISVGGTPNLCDIGGNVCLLPQYLIGGAPGPLTATRDAGTDEVVLMGSFTADFSGVATSVAGGVELCDLGTTVTNCGNSFLSFSNHLFDVQDQIAVAAGQLVQVEVRYSFG